MVRQAQNEHFQNLVTGELAEIEAAVTEPSLSRAIQIRVMVNALEFEGFTREEAVQIVSNSRMVE